ncbi:uncharacterized protein G2W53_024545 [Senna tora]|uniref:Uncharacterized protein n=1 Tax=Senna tora TaxID=362788 RepID=A0A834TC79_9FABA|nr:uncharacterized protein G2W53_024545 [Senna tora]
MERELPMKLVCERAGTRLVSAGVSNLVSTSSFINSISSSFSTPSFLFTSNRSASS